MLIQQLCSKVTSLLLQAKCSFSNFVQKQLVSNNKWNAHSAKRRFLDEIFSAMAVEVRREWVEEEGKGKVGNDRGR